MISHLVNKKLSIFIDLLHSNDFHNHCKIIAASNIQTLDVFGKIDGMTFGDIDKNETGKHPLVWHGFEHDRNNEKYLRLMKVLKQVLNDRIPHFFDFLEKINCNKCLNFSKLYKY